MACCTPIQQLGLLWARERPGELTHLNKNLRDQRFAKNHNSVLIQALENGSFDRLLNQPFANSFYKWMSASFALDLSAIVTVALPALAEVNHDALNELTEQKEM